MLLSFNFFSKHFQFFLINAVGEGAVSNLGQALVKGNPENLGNFLRLQDKLLRFPIHPEKIDIADLLVMKWTAVKYFMEGKPALTAVEEIFRGGGAAQFFLQLP